MAKKPDKSSYRKTLDNKDPIFHNKGNKERGLELIANKAEHVEELADLRHKNKGAIYIGRKTDHSR
ncbi:hypothetical protein QS257_12550 [Terrilactibacillus sp. S3-3]|nr:hypothetical protein QS257_12550 [Terrilactibacillus sp. S3-3]